MPLRLFSSGWPGHLLAAGAGALVTLSLAPFGLWPLGILSLALLARLLDDLTPRQALWRGWCYGAGFWLAGVSWVYVSIHVYGYAPVPLAASLTGLFCVALGLLHAGFAWSYVRWVRDRRGGRWLGFAALWVLWEWLRSWLLTGFPWLYIGYAHLDSPLSGWVPLFGVFGASLAAAITAGALAFPSQLFARDRFATPPSRRPSGRQLSALLTIALLWLGGAALSFMDWVRPHGEPVTVALVQANIPQAVKWDAAQYRATLDTYAAMSEPLWSQADIVVWPEAAITSFYDQARPFLELQAERAETHGATFITGLPWREPAADGLRPRYFNSALALGNGSGIYHKQRLVPFGEYVPLESLLRGLIQFFDLPMSNFQAGDSDQPPLRAGELQLGPLICYEVVYPALVTDWLPQTDVLLTISNDAWFGRSSGPLQHLEMAQMRALETGRPMIRGTGNGVTALIDARGTITARLPQFERANLVGDIQPTQGLTPFARFGIWPVLVIAVGVLGALRQPGVKLRASQLD